MAESWRDPFDLGAKPRESEAATWTDTALNLAAGIPDIVAGAAGAVEYAQSLLGDTPHPQDTAVRQGAEQFSSFIREGLSPAGKESSEASFLPGQGDVSAYETGLSDALWMQGARALPSMLASIIPATAAARGVLAMGGSGTKAALAAGVAGRASEAALNAGDVAGNIYSEIEKMSDEELLATSDLFAGYLADSPKDPAKARALYMRDVAGAAPLVAGVAGALFAGADVMAAKKLVGIGTAGGITKRTLKGTGAEAGEEAVQGLAGGWSVEDALVRAGIRDAVDWQSVLAQGLGGAVLGGPMGGAVGAISRDSAPVPNATTSASKAPVTAQKAAPIVTQSAAPSTLTNKPVSAALAPITPAATTTTTGKQTALTPVAAPTALVNAVLTNNPNPVTPSGTAATVDPATKPVRTQYTTQREYVAALNAWKAQGKNPASAHPQPADVSTIVPVSPTNGAGTQQPAPEQRIIGAGPYQNVGATTQGAPVASPNTTLPTGNPQNQPVRSRRNYKKAESVLVTPTTTDIVAPGAPSAEQTAALTAKNFNTAIETPPTTAQAAPPPPTSVTEPGITPQAPAPPAPPPTGEPTRDMFPDGYRGGQAFIAALIDYRRAQQAPAAAPVAPATPTAPQGPTATSGAPMAPQGPSPGYAGPPAGPTLEQPPVAPNVAPVPPETTVTSPPQVGAGAPPVEPQIDPVTGRRILPAQDAVAQANAARAAADNEAIRRRLETIDEPPPPVLTPEEKGVGGKMKPEVKEERRRINQAAIQITEANPPQEIENDLSGSGVRMVRSRAALQQRMQRMVAAAREANIKIPQRFQKTVDKSIEYNGPLMVLRQAERLLARKPQRDGTWGVKKEDLIQFTRVESAVRTGDIDAAREIMKEGGDAAKKRGNKVTGQTTQEVDEDEDAEVDDTPEGIDTDTDDVEAVEPEADAAEETVEQDVEDEGPVTTVVTPDKRPDERGGRAAPEEVAKITKRTTPAVEAVKRRALAGAEQKAALLKAAAERAKAKMAKARSEAARHEGTERKTPGEYIKDTAETTGKEEAKADAAQAVVDAQLAVPEPITADPEIRFVPEVEELITKSSNKSRLSATNDLRKAKNNATRHGKLSVFLDEYADYIALNADTEAFTYVQGVQSKTFSMFANKIKALVPDVEVYFIDGDAFPRRNVRGMYDPITNVIFVRNFDEPWRMAQTLLHEGVHAAFTNIIWSNQKVRDQLTEILNAVKAYQKETKYNNPGADYGLSNIDELVAEGNANPAFQELLLLTPAPQTLIDSLKLNNRTNSLWGAFTSIVRNALGLRTVPISAFDALMRINANLEASDPSLIGPLSRNALRARTNVAFEKQYGRKFKTVEAGAVAEALNPLALQMPWQQSQVDLADQTKGPRALYWRTLDQIAQVSKDYGDKFAKQVRTISNTLERMRTRGADLLREAQPLIRDEIALQKKYRNVVIGQDANGNDITQWQQYTELLHDETMAGVFADRPLSAQPHLGQTSMLGEWARAQHADLAAVYNSLPADLKAQRKASLDYFRNQQDTISKLTIRNVLHAMGIYDGALETRLHDGVTTPADKARLGDTYDHMMNARGLRAIKGPYFPLMRFGDFVVRATYNLKKPANATEVETGTFEFTDEQEMRAYLRSVPKSTRPKIRRFYVDAATNSPWVTTAQGQTVRITSADPGAEWRGHVMLQDQHVEFFATMTEARAAEAAYRKSGMFSEVKEAVNRKTQPEGADANLLSTQMKSLINNLQSKPGFKALSKTAQDQTIKSLQEASLRALGSTRVQSRFLPRAYVQGASRNTPRATFEYAHSTSNLIARLENQGALEKARNAMTASVQGMDTKSAARQLISNEVEKRINLATVHEDWGWLGDWGKRISTLAFIKYLASPMYSVLNSLQTPMVTLPQLAARHNITKASKALFKAYDDIGALRVTKEGMVATYEKFRRPGDPELDFMDSILARITDRGERAVLLRAMEYGTINRDAGFELGKMVQNPGGIEGGVDTLLGWMQGVSTQMPRAVENINRAVSVITAYRLEKAKSGSHQKASEYALEVANLTQGKYSHTDAPPIFKHPLGRIAFQFKKYGQLVYGLMGHHIGKAIRNEHQGDRAEAIAALSLTLGAHVIMAGMLGLPTEPIKFAVMAMNLLGITEMKWIDVENGARDLATDWFGKELGEVATRGISRALPDAIAFDISNRVGWSDLASWAEPSSNNPDDLFSYAGKLALGAPGNMVFGALDGFSDLAEGKWATGFEKIALLKIASDIGRAVRQYGEGKKTPAGYESFTPYSITEAFMRGVGLTPAREAESVEQRGYYDHIQKRTSGDRTDIMHMWYEATPSERQSLWGRVEEYNRGKVGAAKLTRTELNAYAKRRASEERRGVVKQGYRVSKRDNALYESTRDTYNLR